MASPRAKPRQGKRTPTFASAYAIFEGGGAKGIAHVGAYRAMNRAGLALRGVAGASAGAIFAALVAVGYSADEIFKDADNHILSTLQVGSPVDLIGQPQWKRIKSLSLFLKLVIGGIVGSTLLSTLLAAMVIGAALGSYLPFVAEAVCFLGITLLAARLAHGLVYRTRKITHLILAALGIVSVVILIVTLHAPVWSVAALTGISLAVLTIALIRDAPILFVIGTVTCLAVAISLAWGAILPIWLIPAVLICTMFGTAIVALGWLRPLLTQQGLVNNWVVQNVVNQALRAKLAETWDTDSQGELPETILFKHIEPTANNKCIPLKIVATNIDLSRLSIIDGRHPEVAVGQAVAASAALPVIFCPAQIDGLDSHGHRYADGGLVSNLPSWIFRDEKRRLERQEAHYAAEFRRIPVIAVALEEHGDDHPIPVGKFKRLVRWLADRPYLPFYYVAKFLRNPASRHQIMRFQTSQRYFSDLISTAIFASQGVVREFVSDLRVIPVTTRLKTMQLDCSGEEAAAEIDSAERQTYRWFEREDKRDRLTAILLEQIRDAIASAMRQSLGRPRLRAGDLRIILIEPLSRGMAGEAIALQVRYVVGGDPESNTDDELEIDLRGGISAKAFTSGTVTYGQFNGVGAGPLWMTKYEHALLHRNLKNCIAIPIIGTDGSVERIISVDSRIDLLPTERDEAFKKMLVSVCVPFRSDLFENLLEGQSHDS